MLTCLLWQTENGALMDEPASALLTLLEAPLIAVAVLIGEASAADAHIDSIVATGVLEEIALAEERMEVNDTLTTATAAWAIRRTTTGDLTMEQGADLDAVIADARAYASEHPGELAEYDQGYAAFVDELRGEG